MIIDNLANLQSYTALCTRLASVVGFIAHHDLAEMAVGHYPIMDNDVWVNIQEGPGKSRAEATIEYHEQMIDLQIPLTAAETYGYADVTQADKTGFDATRDIGFLPSVAPAGYVTCQPGMFAIFFPQDGHAPMITDEGVVFKKAIFKIKV